ncbi:MAG: Gentisate 1,2-dioxygenase [Chloroflexi bacterium]|jgi:mannose-6-phosphate isomerase-like protein (cupin superfamily)|nr:MAG: Gentisate 1,2-dioxygenase [Chloroflexota bacterium]
MAVDLHFSAYEQWVENEGIPVAKGWSVNPVELQVAPWERKGALGSIIHLNAMDDFADAYVLELPAGASSTADRHLFEEVLYVLKGRGATSVWLDDGYRQTFEWQEGSLFSIPLNANYQHFNGSGDESARILAITGAPFMMNMFHSMDFIYNNPFVFSERFGDADFFQGEGKLHPVRPGRTWWETNFVPDARNFLLKEWKERGAGGINLQFNLADNNMHTHISEFPVATYKKAHGHAAGAQIIILEGTGFSLVWPDNQYWKGNGGGFDEVVKIDWKPGVFFAPVGYHQHFNTGPTPARYMAIGFGGPRYFVATDLGTGGTKILEVMDKSVKDGGIQIEYEDEDPSILDWFEAECTSNGVQSRMREIMGR